MNKVLEINQLTKKFGSFTAVNNVTFSVEKGNVYGLLGPNGSGKSTTLGMILNVINPTAGSWKWFDQEPDNDSLKKIGAIIESPKFYPYLSAEKNLEIVATIKGVPNSRIDEVLETVNLLARKKDAFKTYSLGMKQRLSIASALLANPQVLILDEPTNGLDPEGIIQIRDIINSIAKSGTTIIVASHLLDEIEKICSHVIVLKHGTAIYSGSVDAMSNTKGFFELKSDNPELLISALNQLNVFSSVKEKDQLVIAQISEDISASELNRKLFEKGISLSHLQKKKESLETQFLELVKQTNS